MNLVILVPALIVSALIVWAINHYRKHRAIPGIDLSKFQDVADNAEKVLENHTDLLDSTEEFLDECDAMRERVREACHSQFWFLCQLKQDMTPEAKHDECMFIVQIYDEVVGFGIDEEHKKEHYRRVEKMRDAIEKIYQQEKGEEK